MKAGVARLLASMLLARSVAALAAVPRRLSVGAGHIAATAAVGSVAARPSRHGLIRMMTPPPAGESAVAEAPKVQAAPVVLPTNENSDRLLRIRHSTAHVMAMAVQRLYNDTKVTIGPWIEKGFYYDFDKEKPFEDKDLPRIKKEMVKLIGLKLPISREEVSYSEAKSRIEAAGETYKLELLEDIHTRDPAAPITIYHIGEPGKARWWDLCAGPHVEHTGQLPADAIELESIAGAYWRGDEKRPMLQRIYGTAWETAEQLAEYARLREEAKRRDHRTLGKQLKLFSIQQDAGGGLVFWHPKGARVRRLMEDFWRDAHIKNGYELLYTPHMASLDLWKTSGHFDFYKEGMFDQMEVEGSQYQIKPMNCPFHVLVYKDEMRSYRDLPLRWAELGTVYRYERSGTLNGLFRVRGFTQDDAHIFCLPSQLADEIVGVLDLFETILTRFGFTEYEVMLSTRPEKAVGSDEIWDKATTALKDALGTKGWDYQVDEGGGAFYGPKIDIKIKDAIGRLWQCSTVQCDFNLPQRFGMDYVAADGSKAQPIMLHRAIFGSIERFFGVLIESTAGDFPFWLAPTQLRLLPVSDDFLPYCVAAVAKLAAAGVRAEVDPGGRSVGKQIKIANQDKIPILSVVGSAEVEAGTLKLEMRKGSQLGEFPVAEAVALLAAAANKAVEPIDVQAL